MKARETTKKKYDVIILGAGWSGLLACKYCLREKLNVLVLESRDNLGGVWAFSTDPLFGGVMKTTQTTSSRCITEISDFPMPSDYPNFPSHTEILDYLRNYASHFRLYEHIRFSQRVHKVSKTDGIWRVMCMDGRYYLARNLVVACGVHQYPNELSRNKRFCSYTGNILHSAAIKEVSHDYSGKTVVVWGGGESASDIVAAATKVAHRVYWCIPNGQWFVPKIVDRWPPFPSARPKVVDHMSSRLRLFLSPTHQYSPFISQYLEHTFGFNGHNQEAWRTAAPYNRAFFNKSSEVLTQVRAGQVIPKRDIAACECRQVHFTDGSTVEADVIITCSGYRVVFPFFEPTCAPQSDPRTWYKCLFWNNDPSIALIGFVRPIFGSIPGIAELQSRYAALVFAGKLDLPSKNERTRFINRDRAFWTHHFRNTSLRIRGLVDHFIYCNQMAQLIGCQPRLLRLLLRAPRKWWTIISSPWNGCQFWLEDTSQHKRIFETLGQYRKNQVSEVYTFLLLAPFLPFIGLCSYARIFFKEHFVPMRPRMVESIKSNQPVGSAAHSKAELSCSFDD